MDHSSDRPRVLFTCLEKTSFVREDLQILRKKFDVSVFQFDAHQQEGFLKRAGRLAQCVKEQLTWLRREIKQADLVYGWFADYHMCLPVIYGRWYDIPTTIMLGGMDCNHLPEYDYGIKESAWRAPISRFVMANATQLIVPDASLINWSSGFTAWPDPHEDGLEARVGNRHAPVSVIPLGFAPDAWKIGPSNRNRQVLSVAYIPDKRTFHVKGVDHVLAAARNMQDVFFRVVGIEPGFADQLRGPDRVPENVALLPPCPRDELSGYYQEASVFAQLSRIESFGMVVGEAMLSGCMPVVSNVGALPNVAGSHGFVVDQPDVTVLVNAISQALAKADSHRQIVRNHVVQNFHIESRERRLLALLEELSR